MSKQVNPLVIVGDIPVIKYDEIGKLTLMAAGCGYIMARRPRCYPAILTVREWNALSGTPPVYAAACPHCEENS